jgi:hypothetical protein
MGYGHERPSTSRVSAGVPDLKSVTVFSLLIAYGVRIAAIAKYVSHMNLYIFFDSFVNTKM